MVYITLQILNVAYIKTARTSKKEGKWRDKTA